MELKGKLEYHSLFEPIRLFTDSGEINLWDHYNKVFTDLNDKKCLHDIQMNSYSVREDENSEYELKYESNFFGTENATLVIILDKIDGFGFSNIGSFLPQILQRLNGMKVVIDIQSNHSITINKDPDEKVYGLYYTDGNSCKIPDGVVKALCKIGESDCCIFCSVSSNGFECLKFSSTCRLLLDRHSKGTIRANRIGNCEILGRKEE